MPLDLYLSQWKYALDIILEIGLSGAKPSVTPLEQDHNLATDKSPFLSSSDEYRQLIGRLIYLIITLP